MPLATTARSMRLVHWTTPDGTRGTFTAPSAEAPSDSSETMNADTPPPSPLAPEHAARFRMAAADLDRARELDLTATTLPRLIMEFDRVRAALDDALQLVTEVAQPDGRTPLN